MTLDCDHCNDIRSRLQPAPGWPKGFMLVDGEGIRFSHLYTLTREQIIACHCPCHDTWKWTHRVTQ